jgi:hypothetical protein
MTEQEIRKDERSKLIQEIAEMFKDEALAVDESQAREVITPDEFIKRLATPKELLT